MRGERGAERRDAEQDRSTEERGSSPVAIAQPSAQGCAHRAPQQHHRRDYLGFNWPQMEGGVQQGGNTSLFVIWVAASAATAGVDLWI